MLMYNCDLIATLVEFIRTKRYHCAKFPKAYKFKDLVDCVCNENLPKDCSEYVNILIKY